MRTPAEDLVTLISYMAGCKGKIVWDATKPDGQPRRRQPLSMTADTLWRRLGFDNESCIFLLLQRLFVS